MKVRLRNLLMMAGFAIIAALGLMVGIRLTPVDPAVWHVDLADRRPAELRGLAMPQGPVQVNILRNGAYFEASGTDHAKAQKLLSKLDDIALQTPGTRRLAGSLADGHITWETRSAFWGFPDLTTAQITDMGLTVYARSRFGGYDWGVNAARLTDWLSKT